MKRQVQLTVTVDVEVPDEWDEDTTQFMVEEHDCASDYVRRLNDQVKKDDENGVCNICVRARLKLMPRGLHGPTPA